MIEVFIQFCVNLWTLSTNGLEVIKYFAFGLPYFRVAMILVAGYFTYRMSVYEFQTIKDPFIKAGRRRI